VACAVPKRTPVREREKERKREKKREKERKRAKEQTWQTKERKSMLVFCVFFVRGFLFFLVSLSRTLSLPLSSKNRHCKRVEKKKRSTKHFFVEVSLSRFCSRFMIQTRRIGLGWLPGASIGVLSGFFIFNEPLREFHAVQEKKNTNKSKTIDNNNNNKNNEKSSSSSE